MPEEQNATSSSDGEDEYRCRICNVKFETETMKNLHVLSHPTDCLNENEIHHRRKLLYKEVKKQQAEERPNFGDNVKLQLPQSPHKPRRIYKPPSKRACLTKIRMEDCLRCDACSCIYIDPQDYYKHMRNFHQKYNTVIPRIRRRSPVSHHRVISHIEQAQESAVNVPDKCQPGLPKAHQSLDTSFIADSIIRQSIKSRWSKVVSNRLSAAKRARVNDDPQTVETKIKEEPIDDGMSYYLSQVEVKIKTEPPDDYQSYS